MFNEELIDTVHKFKNAVFMNEVLKRSNDIIKFLKNDGKDPHKLLKSLAVASARIVKEIVKEFGDDAGLCDSMFRKTYELILEEEEKREKEEDEIYNFNNFQLS